MAYVSQGEETVISVIPLGSCSELRVTSITKDNELVALDLRKWFWTQKDITKTPTKSGVRLSKDNIGDLLAVLASVADEDAKERVLVMLNGDK